MADWMGFGSLVRVLDVSRGLRSWSRRGRRALQGFWVSHMLHTQFCPGAAACSCSCHVREFSCELDGRDGKIRLMGA